MPFLVLSTDANQRLVRCKVSVRPSQFVGDCRDDWVVEFLVNPFSSLGKLFSTFDELRSTTVGDSVFNFAVDDLFEFVNNAIDYVFGAFDASMLKVCLLYTSPSPRDQRGSRMPSSA